MAAGPARHRWPGEGRQGKRWRHQEWPRPEWPRWVRLPSLIPHERRTRQVLSGELYSPNVSDPSRADSRPAHMAVPPFRSRALQPPGDARWGIFLKGARSIEGSGPICPESMPAGGIRRYSGSTIGVRYADRPSDRPAGDGPDRWARLVLSEALGSTRPGSWDAQRRIKSGWLRRCASIDVVSFGKMP